MDDLSGLDGSRQDTNLSQYTINDPNVLHLLSSNMGRWTLNTIT